MIALCSPACLNLDPATFRESLDREPFGFSHNLSELDLFNSDSLLGLAEKYADHPRDHYVAAGAPVPGAEFYSVPYAGYSPRDALDRLDSVGCRVLMKRPEKHDPRFRELLDALFRQVVDLRGGLGHERVLRLESAVLISSAATITPFHFDPEVNFFAQIEGEKVYHVFSPSALTESELERFYIRGVVNIGQVQLKGRDAGREHVFTLGPGKGLHQPQKRAPLGRDPRVAVGLLCFRVRDQRHPRPGPREGLQLLPAQTPAQPRPSRGSSQTRRPEGWHDAR